jgi:hypothetical protein
MPLTRSRPLEALYAGCFAAHRVHRVVRARPVSMLGVILVNQPSPGARCSWFILPCGLSSSEFLRFCSRSIPFGSEHYLPGFRPSSRYHRARPLDTAAPTLPLRSALRLSQPLGGLLRPRLCGLVPSRNHVQGSSRPGVSPSVQLPSLVGKNCPLAVVCSALTAPERATATLGILDFEAFFHTKKRFSGSVISLPFVRSPLRAPPPPGLAHPRSGPRLPATIRS